ncbi:Ltp family lipoprotein [Massilioclostridium coli]|uniref:Ltp family lipoprotein n=1 Tax=Massilioclostridium coli TaxID=1870991 RepID=UPI00085BCE40|nr:Ltp family lipoprotein [Massilioclostridium coli]
MKKLFVLLFAIIVPLSLAACDTGTTATGEESSNYSTDYADVFSMLEDTVSKASQPEVTQSESGSQSANPADQMTIGQRNALESAKSYLSFSEFSYTGLIEQLEYEKYSHEDAVYAADHCGADWNEQALKSAKSYLEYSAFSYTGLIEQLEYEGFTNDQATYGVDNSGANWNEQAAKSAKSYLEYSSFSREGLIEQLEYEGFTHEQAVYGVQQNGY